MAKYPTYAQILALPLSQQLPAIADFAHRSRLAEIKAMAAAVRLLEAEHAAIKAAGYDIHPNSLSDAYGEKMTIRISGPSMEGECRLLKALLATGFTVQERDDRGPLLTLLRLKKGRLGIRMSIRTAGAEELLDAPQKEVA